MMASVCVACYGLKDSCFVGSFFKFEIRNLKWTDSTNPISQLGRDPDMFPITPTPLRFDSPACRQPAFRSVS
jgi:hypothetical protein